MEMLEELYLEQIEDYCNVIFDRNKLPAGVRLAINELVKNDPSSYRVTSEKLSDMSITYTGSDSLPSYIVNWIEAYRRPHLVGNKEKKRL